MSNNDGNSGALLYVSQKMKERERETLESGIFLPSGARHAAT